MVTSHGNLVTIATRYVAECLLSQGISIPNMNSIQLKTNELLVFHSGCHGNQVPIAARYEADAYCPDERVIDVSLWLPW